MTNASKSSWDANNPQRTFSIGSPDLDFFVITDNLVEPKLFQHKWKKHASLAHFIPCFCHDL